MFLYPAKTQIIWQPERAPYTIYIINYGDFKFFLFLNHSVNKSIFLFAEIQLYSRQTKTNIRGNGDGIRQFSWSHEGRA